MRWDVLQNTTRIDEDVDIIGKRRGFGRVLDGQMPLSPVLVPRRRSDPVVVFDKLIAIIVISDIMHVLMDLLGGRIVVWPVGLGRKAECVVVGWDIALAPGISVPLALGLSFGLAWYTYRFSSQVPPRSTFRS